MCQRHGHGCCKRGRGNLQAPLLHVATMVVMVMAVVAAFGVAPGAAQSFTSVVVFPDANFFTLFGGLDVSVAQQFASNAWEEIVLEEAYVAPQYLLSLEVQPAVGSVELLVTCSTASAKARLDAGVASTGLCVQHPTVATELCTSGQHIPTDTTVSPDVPPPDGDDDDEDLEATTDEPPVLNATTTVQPSTTVGGGNKGGRGFHLGALNPIQSFLVLGAVGLALVAILVLLLANKIQKHRSKYRSPSNERMRELAARFGGEEPPDGLGGAACAGDDDDFGGGDDFRGAGVNQSAGRVGVPGRGSAFSKIANGSGSSNRGKGRRNHRRPSQVPLMRNASDVLGFKEMEEELEFDDEDMRLRVTSFAYAVPTRRSMNHTYDNPDVLSEAPALRQASLAAQHHYERASSIRSGQHPVEYSRADGSQAGSEPCADEPPLYTEPYQLQQQQQQQHPGASENKGILAKQKRLSMENADRRLASFSANAIYTANAPAFGPQPPPITAAEGGANRPPPLPPQHRH